MTEEIPTTPSPNEATVPDSHPFAAQIAAIQQLPDEIKSDPLQVQAYIADMLQETEPEPRAEIAHIVERMGIEGSLQLLVKTLTVEGDGGMLLYNKSRRRTVGGIYFTFFEYWGHKNTPKPKKSPPPDSVPFIWADRLSLIQEAAQEAGQANIPQLTLMGRPGKIIEKGNVVLTTLLPKPQPKDLPKGLPKLPETPTTPYIIYIASRQWHKVKAALANPEDELIIQGYPAFSPQLKAITVFTLKATTKLQEKALWSK